MISSVELSDQKASVKLSVQDQGKFAKKKHGRDKNNFRKNLDADDDE